MDEQETDDYWGSSNISSDIFLEDSVEKFRTGGHDQTDQGQIHPAAFIPTTSLHKSLPQAYFTPTKGSLTTPQLSPSEGSSQSSSTIKRNLGILNSLRKNHSFSSSPLNLQLPKLPALNFQRYSVTSLGESIRRTSISSNISLVRSIVTNVLVLDVGQICQGYNINEVDKPEHSEEATVRAAGNDPTILAVLDQMILRSLAQDHVWGGSKVSDKHSQTCDHLSRFRTKFQKCQLLDAAIFRSDGNVTLRVITFLRNTLSRDLFLEVLGARPSAMRQYVSYLSNRGDYEFLNVCMRYCFGSKAAALAEMSRSDKPNPERFDGTEQFPLATKIHKLTQIKGTLDHCDTVPSSPRDVGGTKDPDPYHLSCYVSLLKRQFTLYQLDLANSVTIPETEHEKLLDASVADTLKYCLSYHPGHHESRDRRDQFSTSAHSICDEYKVSAKIMSWVSLESMAKMRLWQEFENMTLSKPFSTKPRITLLPKQILDIHLINRSPNEIIKKFIEKLYDPEDQHQISSIYLI